MSEVLEPPILTVRDGVMLSPLRQDDAAEMFALIDANRAHLGAWLTWVDRQTGPEASATFLADVGRKYENGAGLELALTVDSALAGMCGFDSIDGERREAEIGYWLARGQTGGGVMTDAVRALVSYGFGTLRLHRVFLKIATGNAASAGVARRLGATREGVERESMLLNGERVDMGVWGLLEAEWAGIEREEIDRLVKERVLLAEANS